MCTGATFSLSLTVYDDDDDHDDHDNGDDDDYDYDDDCNDSIQVSCVLILRRPLMCNLFRMSS
jgi:hypothetical protein